VSPDGISACACPSLEEREAGKLTWEDADEWLTTYEDHDDWYRIVLPALKLKDIAVVADAAGLSERRARDILAGRVLPHRSNRETRALVGEQS